MGRKMLIGLSIGFLLVELVLYCCILGGFLVVPCEFASVVVAFLFSLIFLNFKRNKYLTQLGLLFTVVADVFLVLIEPRNQAIAMTSFSLTQIFYFFNILQQSNSKAQNRINIILRIIFIIAVEIVALIVLKDNADYVSLIAMFYYTNLILNMVFAFVQFKINKLFAVGLLLFLLCDTFVGFQMAFDVYIFISHGSFIYKLFTLPFDFIWFFYVPSQTLIALSCVKNKINKKQIKNNLN